MPPTYAANAVASGAPSYRQDSNSYSGVLQNAVVRRRKPEWIATAESKEDASACRKRMTKRERLETILEFSEEQQDNKSADVRE
eukprot:4603142-Prorocentrum_lima.AAC.1